VSGRFGHTGPQGRAESTSSSSSSRSEIDNISKRRVQRPGLLEAPWRPGGYWHGTGNLATFETTVATALTTLQLRTVTAGMGGDRACGTAYTFAYDNTTKVLTRTSSYVHWWPRRHGCCTLTDIARTGGHLTSANLGISIGMTRARGSHRGCRRSGTGRGTIARQPLPQRVCRPWGCNRANTTSVGLLDTSSSRHVCRDGPSSQ